MSPTGTQVGSPPPPSAFAVVGWAAGLEVAVGLGLDVSVKVAALLEGDDDAGALESVGVAEPLGDAVADALAVGFTGAGVDAAVGRGLLEALAGRRVGLEATGAPVVEAALLGALAVTGGATPGGVSPFTENEKATAPPAGMRREPTPWLE